MGIGRNDKEEAMKPYIVKIHVPSGSRGDRFGQWLQRQLEPHRMIVESVVDDGANLHSISPPPEEKE